MAERQPDGPSPPLKVLILDNSLDILELLSTDLECRGCVVTTGSVSAIRHGEADGARLIAAAAPDVVVFDVAVPYEANWRLAMELQADPGARIPFVLTTTNAQAVRRLIGRDLIELVGKPYDLDTLYDVIVRSAHPESITPNSVAPRGAREPDRRSGQDRRTNVRRQASKIEPEFL
jgi:CheY-like chemotaxis protein